MCKIMKPGHPRWDEFKKRLEGVEGVNMMWTDEEGYTLCCDGSPRMPFSRAILETMDGVDVEGSLVEFRENGGFCDCEVLLNIN